MTALHGHMCFSHVHTKTKSTKTEYAVSGMYTWMTCRGLPPAHLAADAVAQAPGAVVVDEAVAHPQACRASPAASVRCITHQRNTITALGRPEFGLSLCIINPALTAHATHGHCTVLTSACMLCHLIQQLEGILDAILSWLHTRLQRCRHNLQAGKTV